MECSHPQTPNSFGNILSAKTDLHFFSPESFIMGIPVGEPWNFEWLLFSHGGNKNLVFMLFFIFRTLKSIN